MLSQRPEMRVIAPVLMFTFLAQACNGMSTLPPPNPNNSTPPPSWATPGGLETEIAAGMTASSDKATNEANPAFTPLPDSLDRINITFCIDHKVDEACVDPITRAQLIAEIQNEQQFLSENKASISDYSFAMIDQAFVHLLDGLNKNEQALPGAVQINPFVSKFPEAGGGAVGTSTDADGSNPAMNIYLTLKEPSGFPPDSAGSDVHEKFHAAMALLRFNTTGSLFKPDEIKAAEFSTSKYQSQTTQLEEYQAAFLGNVWEVLTARAKGFENDPRYRQTIQGDLALYGVYQPNIAFWLDGKRIKPENPVWQLIYDVGSLKHHKTMSEQFGLQENALEYQILVNKWNAYPWSAEEKVLVNEMISQGIAEGWIESGIYPPIP